MFNRLRRSSRGNRNQFIPAKLNSLLERLLSLPLIFQLVWSAAPRPTLVWGILLIIQGLLPAAIVYLTRLVVDSLVAVTKTGISKDSFNTIFLPVMLMAGALLLTEIINGVLSWIRTIQSELVQDRISALIHDQSATVDLAFYESSDYHDRLERARSDASNHSLGLLENIGNLLQNSITLIAIGTILIPYGVGLPLVLMFSMLPAFWTVIHTNRVYHHWWHRTTSDRRWLNYYDHMLTDGRVAPEMRVFELSPYFQSKYRLLRQHLIKERLNLVKQQGLARLLASSYALLVGGAVLAWMLWRTLTGDFTLGDLALFYQAFSRGQVLLRTALGNIGQIYANSLFVSNLFEFLNLQPAIVDPADPYPAPTVLKQGIRLSQVSFHYPGSDRTALKNLELTIPAGKIVAIVGDNGAGKSTLVKLLCRFYDPDAGQIQFDGIDIKQFSLKDLRRMITVLFQFPVCHNATAEQNIAQGDWQANPGETAIQAAAKGAGAHEFIMGLPKGYETLLGTWFPDGTNLSGGEWQRVALSRAFFRQAPVIILDEPTSAMDPWAEIEWLNRFRTLARGRTSIVITHRFTLAMRADMICVMRAGEIVESGTHEELLAHNGFYAQSWREQTQDPQRPLAPQH